MTNLIKSAQLGPVHSLQVDHHPINLSAHSQLSCQMSHSSTLLVYGHFDPRHVLKDESYGIKNSGHFVELKFWVAIDRRVNYFY